MQTYVHFSLGLVLSQYLFPGDNFAQVLTVGGSLAPDVPAAIKFLADRLQGKQPFREQGKLIGVIQEIFHSLAVWIIAWPYFPFFIGVYSHLASDLISHRSEEFLRTDPSMIWPLPWKIRGLFEYRSEQGKIFSLPEIVISIILALIALALRYCR